VDSISSNTTRYYAILNEFIKWYEGCQNLSSTASIAHIRASFVGLTHSTSLGPRVLDLDATNHITDNKSLFSSRSSMGYLSSNTMSDGSKVLSWCWYY